MPPTPVPRFRHGASVRVLLFASLSASLLLAYCSPVRVVRPIDRGEFSVGAGLGGPLTNLFDLYIPLPLLSVGANAGLGHGLDIEGGINVTPLLYGVLLADLGVNYRPWTPRGWRPSLIAGMHGYLGTDFQPDATRFYPVVSLTAAWKATEGLYPYLGVDNWFELRSDRYDGLDEEHRWLPCVHAGVDLGRKKWHAQIEGKLYVPNLNNTMRPVVNLGAGEYGVWGVFVGVRRDFGR